MFAAFLNARANAGALHTVNDVLDADLEHLRREGRAKGGNPALIVKRASALKPIRAHFGALAPEDIQAGFVRLYIDRRRKTVGDRTISIELAYLRAALRRAADDGRIKSAPKIKVPQARAKARTRVLTWPEMERLREALRSAPLHLRGFVLLSMYTGQRGVHIRALRWEHVDFEAGWIWFTRSNPAAAENKLCADAPIPEALAPHLVEMKRAARSPWVIEWEGGRVGSLRRSFATLLREADVTGVHIHDLRRSFATLMGALDVDLGLLADFMNLDRKTLRRHYAHGASGAVGDAIRRIGMATQPEEEECDK